MGSSPDGIAYVSVVRWVREIDVGGAYRLAIAHAIKRDGPISQFHEVRDLVAPAERHIGKAMDQDDCPFRLSFWQGFEVVFAVLNMSVFQFSRRIGL